MFESKGIDPTDSFGVNLRLSLRENQIYLVEPYETKMPWITDKARLFFDGLFQKNDYFSKIKNWKLFFNDFLELIYFMDHFNFHKKNIYFLIFIFDNVSLETLNMLYILNYSYSFVQLKTVEKNNISNDLESNYQVTCSTNKPKLYMSTLGLLVNTNPRYEGYVLNLNLRQRFLKGNFKLLSIGALFDLTIPINNLGSNINIFKSIGEGTNLICQDIKNSEFPVLITNMEFYKRSDAVIFNFVFKYINILDSVWNGLNILHPNLSSTGIYSLNKFLHLSSNDLNKFFALYSVNTSLNSISNVKSLIELYLLKKLSDNSYKNKNLISQSIYSSNDVFYFKVKGKFINSYYYLPTNMVYEENETYINTQGFIKKMGKLLNFKKEAKTNWQITRKLCSNIKSLTFYSNKKDNDLIQFDLMNVLNFKNYISFHYSASQNLTSLSFYLTKQNSPIIKSLKIFSFKLVKIKIFNTKVKYWLDDFFINNGRDSFSYNSSLLLNCSKVLRMSSTNFF